MKRMSFSNFKLMKIAEALELVSKEPVELTRTDDNDNEKVVAVIGNPTDVVFTSGFPYEMKYKINCLVGLANASLGKK